MVLNNALHCSTPKCSHFCVLSGKCLTFDGTRLTLSGLEMLLDLHAELALSANLPLLNSTSDINKFKTMIWTKRNLIKWSN